MVTMDRSRLLQWGRDQTAPQAPSVISAWKGASKSVWLALAPSTWASPSTARRVCMPLANSGRVFGRSGKGGLPAAGRPHGLE